MCRKRIKGAHWQSLGWVYILLYGIDLKVLSSSTDTQLHEREFQTEGVVMLKVFTDNASVMRSAENNNLWDVCVGR